MKTSFKILQLERLGKKYKQFIIRKEEKGHYVSISSKIYGPTTLKNCENKLKQLRKQ